MIRLATVETKEKKKPRPVPLNTTTLLKIASTQLGIGPARTMQIAERLYIAGYVSYPRTETTHYSPNFDLTGALSVQKSHPVWGQYVQSLLERGHIKAKEGEPSYAIQNSR